MSDELELYHKYRPRKLSDLRGQKEAVSMVSEWVRNGRVPHALLLSGPSGVGKTTIAKILKRVLKCSDRDFREQNCAEARGIDDMRSIQQRMNLAPMGGECRIWLLDECFAGDTPVLTSQGNIPIREVRVGDTVRNVTGWGSVEQVFCNRVNLSRVVKLRFSDGSELYTTKQHQFLTDDGWIESQDLDLDVSVFRDCGYIMNRNRPYSIPEVQNEEILRDKSLRLLQNPIHYDSYKAKVLHSEMCLPLSLPKVRIWSNGRANLSLLSNSIYNQVAQQTDLLRAIMRFNYQMSKSQSSRKIIQSRSTKKNQRVSSENVDHRARKSGSGRQIVSHESQQPYGQPRNHRKDDKNQGSQWNTSYLAGRTGWEWEDNSLGTGSFQCCSEVGEGLGDADGYPYRMCPEERRVSSVLQSRYRERHNQIGYRGRWEKSSIEKSYLSRREKDPMSRKVRLVSYQVYKRGCNEQDFVGVIGDQEKANGYVEFYDLQVGGHPSYLANGFTVHNCHKLSGDAMSSLLIPLENTPRHVYFFLATTDPDKLLAAIRTRCTHVPLKALPDEEIHTLLQEVLTKEGKEVSKAVLRRIVEKAEGSARMALVDLHKVVGLPSEQEQLDAIISSDTRKKAIDLARAVMDRRGKWPAVAAILQELDDDPETVRRVILGYANSVLLKGGSLAGRAYLVLEEFKETFFYTGKPGITRAAFAVFHANN